MLYSRLENRRMKNKDAKENIKGRPRKQLQPLRELKVRVRPMLVDSSFLKTWAILFVVRFSINTGAPNENIVQNHLNVALFNVF